MPLNFQNMEKARRPSLLVAIFLAISLLVLVVYCGEGESGPIHRLQGAAQGVIAPVSSVGATVGQGVETLSVAASDAGADSSTLSGLTEQNQQLRNTISQLEEYRQEAQRLEGLLGMRDKYSIEGTAARVIGRSSEAYSQTVTIDAGSSSGVVAGQTVMGPSSVVGQVVSTNNSSSVVRLLTDPNSGVGVTVQSSGASGIVKGSLEGLLYLEDVDTNTTVSVGDVVVTSGMGGSYVAGLMVGTVVRIDDKQGSASRKIVVEPNDGSSPLQEVIAIRSADADSGSSNANNSNSNTNANANANSDSDSDSNIGSSNSGGNKNSTNSANNNASDYDEDDE